MTTDTENRAYFEALRQRVCSAVVRGELEKALGICDEALLWAEQHGSEADLDLATINRDAVLLHLGRGESAIRSFQKILMRSRETMNRHLAAYNIAFYYETGGAFSKSRFYAEIALDHAKQIDSNIYLARSYNQLGNLLIRESKFSEALEYHDKAYGFFTDEQYYERLAVLASMGYCHLACGDFTEGFERLFTVRRSYIQLKMRPGMALGRLHLSFCFGYLQIEKYRQAILHGKTGMRIGENCADSDLVKKALYLLGETAKLNGDHMAAYTHFAKLQEDFYPDNPLLPDLLLGNETKKLVNLWA